MKTATQIAKELGTSVYKLHRFLCKQGFLKSTHQGYRLVNPRYGKLIKCYRGQFTGICPEYQKYNELGEQKIKEIWMKNKLKLRNEAILPENPHIELDVRTKLHELGVTRWQGGEDILFKGNAKPGFPIKLNDDNQVVYTTNSDGQYHVISGTEWLNRHGIFVTGQDVLVTDDHSSRWIRRIWLHGNVCVANSTAYKYRNHEAFRTYKWHEIKSPYPPFEEAEPTIHIPEGDYSVKQLEEFFKNEHKR